MRSFALIAVFAIGCGGDCIPKEAVTAASFAVNSAPASDVRVVHSADELRAATTGAHLSFPPSPRVHRDVPSDPTSEETNARKLLDEFIAATNFATTEIALVHAGGERALLRGLATSGPTTTIYFTGVCSACAGGNPGSYYDAAEAEKEARADRTELVRVPRGLHVVLHVCSIECGSCARNVP
ncbi:MAG TPA: hypothetical protein VGH87_25940 [Polyangiaceae bacterium]